MCAATMTARVIASFHSAVVSRKIRELFPSAGSGSVWTSAYFRWTGKYIKKSSRL
jgi:hypothetical protein